MSSLVRCCGTYYKNQSKTFHKLFLAIASKHKAFAQNYSGGLVRTFMMSLGELGYTDLRFGNMKEQVKAGELEKLTTGEEWEIHLARIIFLGFAFIFTLVAINLLNAIAFGDVQVGS